MATPGNHTRELSWDYSDAEEIRRLDPDLESTPLLGDTRRTPGYSINGDSSVVTLSQSRLESILNNLEHSTTLLKYYISNSSISPEHNGRTLNPRERSTSNVAAGVDEDVQISALSCCCACWKQWWRKHSLTQHFTHFLLIITLILQASFIAIISVLDILPHKKLPHTSPPPDYIMASGAVMITLQFANLLVLIFTTVRLTGQVMRHRVSGALLGQSYLATILVFTGIYTVTYRLNSSGWHDISDNLRKNPDLIADLYVKMFYLSVSTATLCGSCPITSHIWYNHIIICIQMMLSFVYFAQILAQAMQPGAPAFRPPGGSARERSQVSDRNEQENDSSR